MAARAAPQDRVQAMMIASEAELDELLSRPNEGDIAAVRELRDPLVLLGVGGKMGPTLARRAVRAVQEAGINLRVVGVSRFTDAATRRQLEDWGVSTIAADLLDNAQLAALPDSENVAFLTGRKFGSTGAESLTWAMNVFVPALVSQRYGNSRIVAL